MPGSNPTPPFTSPAILSHSPAQSQFLRLQKGNNNTDLVGLAGGIEGSTVRALRIQEAPGAAAFVAASLTLGSPPPYPLSPARASVQGGGAGRWGWPGAVARAVASPRARPAAETPPPSAAGRRPRGRQRASRECGAAARGGGLAGRTPPHADSPHSSRLTRRRAAPPRPPAPPLPAAFPQGAALLGGSLPGSSKAPPTRVRALQTESLPIPSSCRLLNLGAPRRAPPYALSLPLPVASNSHSPLPAISQLRAAAPMPSPPPEGPVSQLAPPRGSPGPWLRPGCCSRGNEPSPRGCSPHLPQPRPLPGEPVSESGARWGFGSRLCLFPPRTSRCRPHCASGSLSVCWGQVKLLRALCN